jgi:hypothetical protein
MVTDEVQQQNMRKLIWWKNEIAKMDTVESSKVAATIWLFRDIRKK